MTLEVIVVRGQQHPGQVATQTSPIQVSLANGTILQWEHCIHELINASINSPKEHNMDSSSENR